MAKKIIDTAIVGGGVSGAYSAWRLALGRGPRAKADDIHLFEMSDRIGGRLYSIHMPGMPRTITELGGMRYMSLQHIVVGVIEQLGLDTEHFPMGGDQNLAYLRGKRFPVRDFEDSQVVPFDLPPWERGESPAHLMVAAMENIVPGISEMTPDQRRAACDKRKLDGIPLRDYGFWSVLLDQLSNEGYSLALQGGGYNTLLSNWNCADAIPWYFTDFSKNIREIEYSTLSKGMDLIPRRLCTEFQERHGRVHMRTELIGFNKSQDGKHLDLIVRDHKSGDDRTYRTRRLVLALPQWAISKLAQHAPDRPSPNAFFRKKSVNEILQSVTPRSLYKFALAYDSPWWHMLNLESGRSVTDLPLRQVYYFGAEGDRKGAGKDNRNAYLDCSYTDGVSVGYWEGLRKTGPRFEGRRNRFLKKGEASFIPGHEVSEAMVERASRQLEELHGIPNLPRPYAAVCKNWADEPYGGGWHTWNIGVRSSRVMPKVRQPDPGYPVYICGEAYSASQGWIEGALQTAELMLQEKFSLEPPTWLSGKYDLGP